VELYIHSLNTPSWRGAQLKHRDNFITISYNRFPFPWYFSLSTSGTRHGSGLKFHTVAISLLRAMPLVQLSVFVKNLFYAFLVFFTDVFSPLVTIPVVRMTIRMAKHFCSRFVEFLYLDFYIFSAIFCITFLSDSIATSISKL
jgi:hypothetical protein